VPASAQSRARFFATCLGSSAVSLPRLSVSKGAPLTPPTRVENAARYGPGASHRISGRSATDQLPRRGQLRVSPVELTAQLAARWLLEHRPHARRLRQAKLGEIGAADVEPDVPQA